MNEAIKTLPLGAVQAGKAKEYYRWYVLFMLMVIYIFNLVDRQILTILAPYLKADFGITDAQFGLLFGTTFALFYGLFGIPLARLVDGWSRVGVLSIGLSFWSMMTMASGFATNFMQIAAARVCVGVGEASASPAAISILGDYFPKSMRATVLAIYSAGLYIGMGLSLIVGGKIVGVWDGFLGLKGWQATFLLVGAPGLLLALLVRITIREPIRGALDGVKKPFVDPHPFRSVIRETATMFPPWSFFKLRSAGADKKTMRANILMFLSCAVGAVLITVATNQLLSPERRAPLGSMGGFLITTNLVQWLAIAVGVYATFSWIQSIKFRDKVVHQLIVCTLPFKLVAISSGLLGTFLYVFGAFSFLYGTRYLGMGPETGLTLGVVNVLASVCGVLLGGGLSDRAKRLHPAGRLYLLLFVICVFTVATATQYLTDEVNVFLACSAVAIGFLSMYSPIMLGTSQDLMIPRTRATGSAIITLATNLIGLGMGPYVIGFLSDVTGSLRWALLSTLLIVPPLLILVAMTIKSLPSAEKSLDERARAMGENT